MNQFLTPLADALAQQASDKYVPFDVPGHKGRIPLLNEYFGEQCVALDKNSRSSIDYLCQPRGVIREAEKLTAEAFGAENAFFMVGGTTSSVQAMIMSACMPGEKIILPRNVHSSVINAVILSGAVPVYVDPGVHNSIGISLGMSLCDVQRAISDNMDAKAIFVNNPTYYGICSDLAGIVRLAHAHGMLVLADEAHGTHFYFGDGLPAAAMRCGADMAAISMHKTGGSLTQSSVLLIGQNVSAEHVMNIVNLTRTTSASYLLLASIDIARKNLVTCGRETLNRNISRVNRSRQEINAIGGYYAFGPEIVDRDMVYDYDCTKLSINTLGIGLAGIEVYTMLRDRFGIQLEFGDTGNMLALTTLGDIDEDHELLIDALRRIKEEYGRNEPISFSYEYITPTVCIPPRDAFYAKKVTKPLSECCGRICAEAVMCYPPGVPILAPGEKVTEEIIEHVTYAAHKGCTITGLTEGNEISVVCR